MKRRTDGWLGVALLLLCLPACDRERDEARRLLAQLDAINVAVDHTVRAPAVDALQGLPLDDAQLNDIRGACVSAHLALIEAESQQQAARRDFERVVEGNEEAVSPIDALRVARAIERSQIAFEQAQTLFPTCERHKRDLSLRFARR